MSKIALLHPQCVRQGGAIQMTLQTAGILQEQGHEVILYTFSHSPECFSELQKNVKIQEWGRSVPHFFPGRKLILISTLAWHVRHVDIVIANNPPMQIVAALTKIFPRRHTKTVWWHHHIPWYLLEKSTKHKAQSTKERVIKKIKGFFERNFIAPFIDEMIATSHFVAEQIKTYCGRGATVIHPIVDNRYEIIDKGGQGGIPFHGRGADEGGGVGNNGKDDDGSDGLDSTSRSLKANLAGMTTNTITLFTHGRLESGKGIETIIKTFQKIQNFSEKLQSGPIHLILFGTGSLEGKLKEQGIDVRPFDTRSTLHDLASGQFGHSILGVYCSEIDGFGMAPLESQMMDIPTVILDRAGSRETIVSNDVNEPVGYLVEDKEELFRIISHFVQKKVLPKCEANVNFLHHKAYFLRPRLSQDLFDFMRKIQDGE